MGKELKQIIGVFCIIIPIIILIYFNFNSESLLLPAGYELAIDGYVISRTLVTIFTFYLIVKFGYYMLTKKD